MICKLRLKSALLIAAALSAPMTLSGCANAPAREPLTRQLPAAPSFARPVSVPDPKPGESAIVVASRERSGRQQNASVIERFRNWYGGVRKSYGSKQ